MVRLLWFLTAVTVLALVVGARTGWLRQDGNEYLALVVGAGVLAGLSLGTVVALATAPLPGPTWLVFAGCLAAVGAASWLLLAGAKLALPPIYVLKDVSVWMQLPAWQVMGYFLVPAAVVAAIPSFGLWRWWFR